MPHISIAAEKIGSVFGFPLTNSLVTTWLVMAILIALSYLATKKLTMIPSNGQLIAESVVGMLYGLFESVTGKYVKQFFPLLASIFLYIILANWVGLLPGVGTVGFFKISEGAEATHVTTSAKAPAESPASGSAAAVTHGETTGTAETVPATAAAGVTVPEGGEVEVPETTEPTHEAEFIPLLRGATADINTTLALAIVAVLAIQYYGLRNFGKHYSTRFLNFSNPINFFLGLLEIISEVSKVISFAFRLFGNIFAGEVLLTVMAFLMPFVAPLPFLTLELFVGFIQALVFAMLTAVFLNVAISHGEHEMHMREHAAHASH